MEELVLVLRHNGESVVGECRGEVIVELTELEGIDDVGHIDNPSVVALVVEFEQFFFTCFDLVDESRFLVCVTDGFELGGLLLVFIVAVHALFLEPIAVLHE